MKVLIGIIEDLPGAKVASQNLFEAMTKGEAQVAREWSKKLSHTITEEKTICLSEDDWLVFLTKIRETQKDFKADYIISESQLHFLAKNKQLLPEKLQNLVSLAIERNAVMLELPMDEVEYE